MNTVESDGKEVKAEVNGADLDNQLQALLDENKALQVKESEGDGVKADYILLAKSNSKALKKSEKDLYIEGLAMGDFYLQKEKVNLGAKLQVVPLAFVTLYQERDSLDKNAKFIGVWNKEQAMNFPTVDGNFYDRQLPNGNVLRPVNWVMVDVIGHPEIKNGVIAYKSTGSRIWRAWKEEAKGRAGSSATLVYNIFEDEYSNADNDWTNINFSYASNLLEGAETKKQAIASLIKSNALRSSYGKRTLIGDHSDAPAVTQIEDKNLKSANVDASDTKPTYGEDTDF